MASSKGPKAASIELGNRIVQFLKTLAANASLSTTDLANQLQEKRSRVDRQCRRLVQENILEPCLGIRHKLYCVDCQKVVEKATYDTCKDHDLRQFMDTVREWELILQTNGSQAIA